jgi:hypothetical protein
MRSGWLGMPDWDPPLLRTACAGSQFAGITHHSNHTLYFRPRSADSGTIHEIFFRRIYQLPAGFVPETIMDVGASAGYATLDLASRFPRARLASFEPLASVRLIGGEMHPVLCDPEPLIALIGKTHDVQTEKAESVNYFHFSARLRNRA